MKAYRCDRCGKFCSGYSSCPDVFTNPDGYQRAIYITAVAQDIDLCCTCKGELREWWNAKGAPADVQPDVDEDKEE